MKKYILLLIIPLLFSCGGNADKIEQSEDNYNYEEWSSFSLCDCRKLELIDNKFVSEDIRLNEYCKYQKEEEGSNGYNWVERMNNCIGNWDGEEFVPRNFKTHFNLSETINTELGFSIEFLQAEFFVEECVDGEYCYYSDRSWHESRNNDGLLGGELLVEAEIVNIADTMVIIETEYFLDLATFDQDKWNWELPVEILVENFSTMGGSHKCEDDRNCFNSDYLEGEDDIILNLYPGEKITGWFCFYIDNEDDEFEVFDGKPILPKLALVFESGKDWKWVKWNHYGNSLPYIIHIDSINIIEDVDKYDCTD